MRKYLFLILFFAAAAPVFFWRSGYTNKANEFLAGVFFTDSITLDQLKSDYAVAKKGGEKVKIMIVPGHDDEFGGTEYKGLKEADLNLELAESLAGFLGQENFFEVILSRDKNGYNPKLLSYFSKNRKETEKFISESVKTMNSNIQSGFVQKYTKGVVHNPAPEEAALRLYGINKWANENKVSVVIHVHFNDDPERSSNRIGKYFGFSIYVPEKQFSNAKASMALAGPVFGQLKKYLSVSDLPKEKSGIVEDQKLIALGAYNTLDAAGILIEYGYIYESQFADKKIRPFAFKELAYQTYLGINNFFGENNNKGRPSATFPFSWREDIAEGVKNSKDVFALQAALILENLYPPKSLPKNNCPISGNFGECTAAAVKEFQEKYGIEPAAGFVGLQTRKKLNELYSS